MDKPTEKELKDATDRYMKQASESVKKIPPQERTILSKQELKVTQKKDVHTEHCCLACGCKYSDPDCTVVTGKKKQSASCGQTSVCYDMGYYEDNYYERRAAELEYLIRSKYFECAELDLRWDENYGKYSTMCELWEEAFGEKPPSFKNEDKNE